MKQLFFIVVACVGMALPSLSLCANDRVEQCRKLIAEHNNPGQQEPKLGKKARQRARQRAEQAAQIQVRFPGGQPAQKQAAGRKKHLWQLGKENFDMPVVGNKAAKQRALQEHIQREVEDYL